MLKLIKKIYISTLITLACITSFDALAKKDTLFNTMEFASSDLKAIPKWTTVLDKMKSETKIYDKCNKDITSCNNSLLVEWIEFNNNVTELSNKLDILNSVNGFFNDWPYILDIDLWKVSDYWEIPSEFLDKSGDCEDYAIIKYYTLKELGFDTNKMRIVILKDVVRNGAHAVLAVYLNDQIYILDNLSTIVLKDTDLFQYQPYYSVNEHKRWVHLKNNKRILR